MVDTEQEWWRGAVVYQVYPRSYLDTDGDGVGDLKGVTEKLDYIASLGVDAIWLSPFFKSPMKDYGYDVSDYCDVDPLFGMLADFKALLAKAHSLKLKIIIDQVLSHSSNEHAWFQQSRLSRTNDKADWYVWADPKSDGSPPNNWQSVFGSAAWTYEIRRGQYYFHNFLAEQPDLNLHNPAVRRAVFEALRFWLDLGVDGIRLDAIVHFFHDPRFPDNPPNPKPVPMTSNIDFATPYSMQIHKHDLKIEPALAMAKEFRALLDEYPGRMAVAEVSDSNSVVTANKFTDGPKMLHTAYNFSLISGTQLDGVRIRDAVQEFADAPGDGWPSWAFSNHDVIRVASRWHSDKNGYHHDSRLSKMLIALLTSLRGTIFLYQGEELGLPEAVIPYEKIQDPWGKYLYPLWQGRDGCRTPMPWSGRMPQAGFTSAPMPWLPIDAAHLPLAADMQEDDPASVLHFTRQFLEWRRQEPALITGELKFLDLPDNILGFKRWNDKDTITCLFNLADHATTVNIAEELTTVVEFQDTALSGGIKKRTVSLPPYGFYFGRSTAV